MKTFLIVLNRRTEASQTYALKAGGRVKLRSLEAREKAALVARSIGVESVDDVAWTPKIVGGVRIYLAVI